MASKNTKARNTRKTHEGGAASIIKPLEELKRSVMSCLLWEDTFYEDGVSIADRVKDLVGKVSKEEARQVLYDAKFKSKLRHMPLYLLTLFAEKKWLDKDDVCKICTRVDDMTELLSLYWKDGKKPLSHQLIKGLAQAIPSFDEYKFAKYNRSKAVKLRDVFRIARPKPKDEAQSALWKRVVADELAVPDTWEVVISACGNDNEKKKAEFTRLLTEKARDEETGKEFNKLGDLAFLRNLRKMKEVGVNEAAIRKSFEERNWGWIIPYQFITAASHNPTLEDVLEQAMFKCLDEQEPIEDTSALLVDVSGSMTARISGKSEVRRYEVAAGLAILLREVCKDVKLYTFNENLRVVPPRRGFALRDSICEEVDGGTHMWGAIRGAAADRHNKLMVVITDEQTMDNGRYSDANADLLIIINVASYRNGVGYEKGAVHINGWSDSVIEWLREYMKGGFEKI
jgi:60 kDa SS-A/Ro ribonucleoprotein